MYYAPITYPNPYYPHVNTPVYNTNGMSRNSQGSDKQLIEDILDGIKREASSIDLYRQLADAAPNESHKNDILHALENKRGHLNQFTNLYFSLTGKQPEYETETETFDSYSEGLEKAYQADMEGYEEFQRSGLSTPYPQVQHAFLIASNAQREIASRLEYLNADASNEQTHGDYGSQSFVVNMEDVTKQNDNYRRALWTGEHLQLTLMSIEVGGDIGLEVHPNLDQFLRLEQGQGLVQMGDSEDDVDFEEHVYADYAIFVPAGRWHNLTNTGNEPIKLYSIYAPPEHPFGTVHETKAIAMEAEEHH
ncbi:cupin domain-containing protein [Salipaludibacillus daqingensis]|uniref:cupin domain-containing protein n=1 Tax=Salipaludibacillus daqingensis TaxID=3041001 RepID=UPI0024754BF4|nr:cupin domain-containing protein [Salipaludibacillus daqingensis]